MKQTKIKILLFVICTSLFCCVGRRQSAHAAETVNIQTTQVQAEVGDVVEVAFSLGNNPGTIMYELYITYDTEALQVIEVEDGGYYPEWFPGDVTKAPLYISAGDALAMKNLDECKILAVVKFKILENAAEGEYHFQVRGLFLNANLDEYKVTYQDSGGIKVLSGMNTTAQERDTFKNEISVMETQDTQATQPVQGNAQWETDAENENVQVSSGSSDNSQDLEYLTQNRTEEKDIYEETDIRENVEKEASTAETMLRDIEAVKTSFDMKKGLLCISLLVLIGVIGIFSMVRDKKNVNQ